MDTAVYYIINNWNQYNITITYFLSFYVVLSYKTFVYTHMIYTF